ncbi:MAG: hypothetical protein Q8M15_05480 [Bacteroidota bacterium]|nr:hypothetical protein [Bacteroidota bacterium]
MKKTILLTTMMLLGIFCFGQFGLDQLNNAQTRLVYSQIGFIKKKPGKKTFKTEKVKSYTEINQNLKNKKQISKIVYTLNKMAWSTNYERFNKKNKLIFAWKYKYINDTLISLTYSINKKGDTTYKNTYAYNETGMLTRQESYYKDMNQPKIFETRSYNAQNKLVKNEHYNKNGQLEFRYEYDYYENGSKKETRLYNHKNKLKIKYTYECDLKGEIENKEVKARNYCSKKNVNADGTFVEIFEFKDEKNRIRKTVYNYNKDSTLKQFERFDVKGNLIYKANYYFDDKQQVTFYDTFNRKGKKQNSYQYIYNDKGFVEKFITFNKKNKAVEETSYTYAYGE